jgi:hypothetical protein
MNPKTGEEQAASRNLSEAALRVQPEAALTLRRWADAATTAIRPGSRRLHSHGVRAAAGKSIAAGLAHCAPRRRATAVDYEVKRPRRPPRHLSV